MKNISKVFISFGLMAALTLMLAVVIPGGMLPFEAVALAFEDSDPGPSITSPDNEYTYRDSQGTLHRAEASPGTNKVGDRVTISWSSVSGADSYQVLVKLLDKGVTPDPTNNNESGSLILNIADQPASSRSVKLSLTGSSSSYVDRWVKIAIRAKNSGGAGTLFTFSYFQIGEEETVEELGISVKANQTSANVGETISATATASGGVKPYSYSWAVYNGGSKLEEVAYGVAGATYSYKTSTAGKYFFVVRVKDAEGTQKSYDTDDIVVTDPTLPLSIDVVAKQTTATVGETLSATATASGGVKPYSYSWVVYKDRNIVEELSYGMAGASHSYKANAAGKYYFKVYIKDAKGTEKIDSTADIIVSEAATPLSVDVVAKQTTATVGDTISATATASGGTTPYSYSWLVYKDGSKLEELSYGMAGASYSYKASAAGKYYFKVYVKDAGGTQKYDSTGNIVVSETTSPLSVSAAANQTSANVGDTISATATASGGTKPYSYSWSVYKDGSKLEELSYGMAGASYSYKASAAGRYYFRVYVKDADGTQEYDSTGNIVVSEEVLPLSVSAVANQTSAEVDDTISATATVSGGVKPYSYSWSVYKDGSKLEELSYGMAGASYSYKASAAGRYYFRVYVKDADGTQKYDSTDSIVVAEKAPTLDSISFTYGSDTVNIGKTYKPTIKLSPANVAVTIEWTSSDESVATVDQYGALTPKKLGTVSITARAGGVSYTKILTVANPSVSGVSMDVSGTVKLKKKATLRIYVDVTPETAADDARLYYSTSKRKIVKIIDSGKDSSGRHYVTVKAMKKGTSRITVTCGSYSDSVKIKV